MLLPEGREQELKEQEAHDVPACRDVCAPAPLPPQQPSDDGHRQQLEHLLPRKALKPTCVCEYVCVRVCVFVCAYVYVCVRMCMCVRVCIHVCVRVCCRGCMQNGSKWDISTESMQLQDVQSDHTCL